MEVWPATLPEILIRGFEYKAGEGNVIRTDMESGPARQRRRYSSAPKTTTATWMMTQAQLGIFETFFEDAIFEGSAWFQMKVPIGGQNLLRTVRFKGGTYTAAEEAKEMLWRVSAEIEVAVQ